jgi:3-hydroxyisobutyrate dehydrogenase
MKALNNYVSAAGLVASSEALAIGRRFGLEPKRMVEILNASTGRNNSTENKIAQQVLSGSFASGFALGLMAKDLRTAFELAKATDTPVPLAAACVALWNAAEERLPAGADHTEIARILGAAD